MGRSRQAGLVLAAGLVLVALSQLAATPRAAPLFDGVFIEDPYRFVMPPPGAAGDPLPVQVTTAVVNGAVPLLAVATAENPPQAQIIAEADAFAISAGTTSVTVSIEPVAPTDPHVTGNVYRFGVTDQAGAALAIRPGPVVTIVLRAPQLLDAQLARLDGSQWVILPTDHGGLPDLFAANVDRLGAFTMLPSTAVPTGSGTAPSPGASTGGSNGGGQGGVPPWILALFAIAAVGLGLAWGLLGGGERR